MSSKARGSAKATREPNNAGPALQECPEIEQERPCWKIPNNLTPVSRWTEETLGFAIKKADLTFAIIAQSNRVSRFDVANFVHKRFSKISREKRKRLMIWFQAAGFLPMPKLRVWHVCPDCGAHHIVKGKKNG